MTRRVATRKSLILASGIQKRILEPRREVERAGPLRSSGSEGGQSYKAFQEGNPQVRQDEIVVHLFSDAGSIEMIFLQKDYQNPTGVSQPEIKRIVHSLHEASQVGQWLRKWRSGNDLSQLS
jgi:hypothetical protein